MNVEDTLDRLGRVTSRRPYAYASSWPIEELELAGPGGRERCLLLKRFDDPPKAKPPLVVEPEREIAAYRLLADADLGTPACYGSGRRWLVLEKVEGVELWQLGDRRAWEAAARWAALLHSHFDGRRLSAPPLLRRDAPFHNHWFAQAQALAGEDLNALCPSRDVALARLEALPQTLVHGELYPSNVLIAGPRVAVVDWETAAIGPGVIDLAALVTGLPKDDREAIVQAYGRVDPLDLAAAQLVLAVQWLGWCEGWRPPPEHRRDWLAEARSAAEVLT